MPVSNSDFTVANRNGNDKKYDVNEFKHQLSFTNEIVHGIIDKSLKARAPVS